MRVEKEKWMGAEILQINNQQLSYTVDLDYTHSTVPWLGRLPGEGNGNSLQYSFLGNPMDRLQSMGSQKSRA